MLQSGEKTEINANLDADDLINIQYTSGTTGLPKAATLSHFNILNNAIEIGKIIELNDKDTILCQVMYHKCRFLSTIVSVW